jgi:uncharacterized protein with PQ loop repeat
MALLHMHLHKKDALTALDKAMILSSFVYPLTALPQLIGVLQGHSENVSALSWFSFFVFAFVSLCYSIVHKIKPMIISYTLWCLVDISIVLGILLV